MSSHPWELGMICSCWRCENRCAFPSSFTLEPAHLKGHKSPDMQRGLWRGFLFLSRSPLLSWPLAHAHCPSTCHQFGDIWRKHISRACHGLSNCKVTQQVTRLFPWPTDKGCLEHATFLLREGPLPSLSALTNECSDSSLPFLFHG
jgi:hypothetical protein